MAYNTATEVNDYAALRGIVIAGNVDNMLVLANDFIETKSYQGVKSNSAQLAQWPRAGVYIDGVLIDSNTVPQGIKHSEIEALLAIDSGNNPLSNVARKVKSESVDVIDVVYADDSAASVRLLKLDAMLAPYLFGASLSVSGGAIGGVYRA